MSHPGSSPFGRSQLIRRSPPPTPTQQFQPIDSNPAPATNTVHQEHCSEVVSTPEIQKWMSDIEYLLSEVCSVVSEGKMNSEQKLRVSTICRKVVAGTSNMAVLYQSLKQKTIQAQATIRHMQERENLEHSLKQLKTVLEEKPRSQEQCSFADMVKKSADTFVRPSNLSSVVIYPSDKTKTSEETKSLVQKIISPEEMKLHVRGLKKVRNGGVIISTESKADAEKIMKSDKLTSSGLTVEEPAKRRPRITIVGVPVALSQSEVFDCIYEQNLADKFPASTRESFLTAIKLSHKSGKKNLSSCNYVLEVASNIRRALINQGRIYINWTSCPVKDFTLVTRCYNCQQYGHAAKFCRETSPTCSKCGETGHDSKVCSVKSSIPTCATCKRFKRKCDHHTGDATCPARKFAEDKYINTIDYEGA